MAGTGSDVALNILVMGSFSKALSMERNKIGLRPANTDGGTANDCVGLYCASTDDSAAYSRKLLICMATRQHKVDTGLALESKQYDCIGSVFSSADCSMNNHICQAALRITDSSIENHCI